MFIVKKTILFLVFNNEMSHWASAILPLFEMESDASTRNFHKVSSPGNNGFRSAGSGIQNIAGFSCTNTKKEKLYKLKLGYKK